MRAVDQLVMCRCLKSCLKLLTDSNIPHFSFWYFLSDRIFFQDLYMLIQDFGNIISELKPRKYKFKLLDYYLADVTFHETNVRKK